MLVSADIHSDWSPPDVALFVALVTGFASAINQIIVNHRRTKDADVSALVARAMLVALKGEHLHHGVMTGDLLTAFRDYEASLRAELDNLPRAKRDFIASFAPVRGRA